jgi:hemoglobin-like flavoprotein
VANSTKPGRSILQPIFEMTPDARRLFPNDMERLHLKLMDTIAAIVGVLDNRALLQSIISHTADHHAGFGVSSQYASFGEVLIWSLEHQFGSAFTSDLLKRGLSSMKLYKPK